MISNPRVRATLVAVLMVASFAGAAAWRPTTKLADQRPRVVLEALFPKSFGGWAVDDKMAVQLVSPDAQAVIDKIYGQTLSRTYVNASGQRVMLSVAYGGDQSDANRAHRPEVCYPAQGFQIIANSSGTISLPSHDLHVKKLVAQQGARIEPITYWMVVGDRVVTSSADQKLAQLSYSMHGLIPDGILMRVSTIGGEFEPAFALQRDFVVKLAESLPNSLRSAVVGQVSR